MTKLADAREANLAPEVAANHAQTGRAAVHLIDLRDVLEFADATGLFLKCPLSSANGASASSFSLAAELPSSRDLVVRSAFGRKQSPP